MRAHDRTSERLERRAYLVDAARDRRVLVDAGPDDEHRKSGGQSDRHRRVAVRHGCYSFVDIRR